MSLTHRGWQWFFAVILISVLAACGDDDAGPTPDPDAGADAAQVTQCEVAADCDDGAYCNGAETCDPSHPNADAVTGCVEGVVVTCDDDISCTVDRCDEASSTCESVAPDLDSDGHDDANCLDAAGDSLGDDCDDSDAQRFSGRTETCDPATDDAARDEDCDPTTIGERDLDQDTRVDDACSNTAEDGTVNRGDDCDDDDNLVFGAYCGACMCSVVNATPSCMGGPMQCTIGVCDTGFLDCDGEDNTGCEAARDADTSCGECGNVCTEHASCTTADGLFACACDDGFTGDGVTCTACPTGYVGDGDGNCAPVLTDLTLSVGSLSPALNGVTRNYAVVVGPGVDRIMFRASVVSGVGSGVAVAFNTETVAPGASWQSPALTLGASNTVTIDVSESGHVTSHYVITITRGADIDYLKASNTDSQDEFGANLALDGDTLVITATGESSNATTVNGNQGNNSADYAGAAYVFVWNGSAWQQQAYLKASNAAANDLFGWSVAISGDTIAVAAPLEDSGNRLSPTDNAEESAGAVYVFTRTAGVWTQQAYLKASHPDAGDFFGESVALDGDTLVVGAEGESSAATTINGDATDNSAASAGAAYVFVRSAGQWTQQAYLKANNAGAGDTFGHAIAISGDTIAVGASGEDSNAGAAYVFVRDVGVWTQQAYLKASNAGADDAFGVALGLDGNALVVGAEGEDGEISTSTPDQADLGDAQGAAYVFVRSAGAWSQQAYLKSAYPQIWDAFGAAVAIEAGSVVVTAPGAGGSDPGFDGDQEDLSEGYSGAAYLFTQSGTSWTQVTYLKATNPEFEDNFGVCVAIDNGTIAIGAILEDGDTTGVNGADNNGSFDSGAAYVFR